MKTKKPYNFLKKYREAIAYLIKCEENEIDLMIQSGSKVETKPVSKAELKERFKREIC